ncbi:MAG TPA: peptide chain release factor N(5)-glutamine methyltransferase [Bacteroidota bacterium]|nr:peptide chain release factor N(5)-glutamine methyltransferase [Bacteroidota bacterium]
MESVHRELRNQTILSLLEWGSNELAEGGVESPRLNCELLLSHLLGYKRMELRVKYGSPVLPAQAEEFQSLIARRLHREPLQYITGNTEFMGLNISVQPGVFIPRPETEILVEEAVAACRASTIPPRNILEIGTGSGNIAIALATFLPECHIDTIESSKESILIAKKNIAAYNLADRITQLQGDIFRNGFAPGRKYELLISNPPYVSASDFLETEPEVREHEPAGAITDELDGLTFYRKITTLSNSLLVPGGWVLVEIACNQEEPVSELFRKSGFEKIQSVKDYSGLPRVVKARRGATT